MRSLRTLYTIFSIVFLFSCKSTTESENKETSQSISDSNTASTSSSMNNRVKVLKRINGTQLFYPEFHIKGSKLEVLVTDAKPEKLTSYTEENGKRITTSEIELNYENKKVKQETVSHFEKTSVDKHTFNYSPVNGKTATVRALEGGTATDLEFDNSGNIITRVDYSGPDADGVTYYYHVERDDKGNEKEAILAEGESDTEVKKIVFEYVEFDSEGNWTKRKRKYTVQSYTYEQFNDHFFERKKISGLESPLKLQGEVYEETEERTLEYGAASENVGSSNTGNVETVNTNTSTGPVKSYIQRKCYFHASPAMRVEGDIYRFYEGDTIKIQYYEKTKGYNALVGKYTWENENTLSVNWVKGLKDQAFEPLIKPITETLNFKAEGEPENQVKINNKQFWANCPE